MVDFGDIKLIVSDCDGVLTDNRVLVDENGKEAVFFNRSDGYGIELLKKETDVEFMVLSKERNPVVGARCKKLKVDYIQGIDDKIHTFVAEAKKRGISMDEVCYIGNDLNDKECMEAAGIGIAVNDSYPEVLAIADHVTSKNGGYGAVREIIDMVRNSHK